MLEEIRIQSLGVIDSSTLELGPGLTVITGETGAGKTMIVTALGLLLGGRADSGAVRTGARSARVEGVVGALGAAALRRRGRGGRRRGRGRPGRAGPQRLRRGPLARLRRRRRGARGRRSAGSPSRWWPCTGSPTSTGCCSRAPSATRWTASAVSDTAGLVATYADLFARLAATERELADVVEHARERAREADLLRFGLDEIEQVSPEPGEDEALAAEETRLGFADTLRLAAEQAREALSSEHGAPDALATVTAARTALEGVREHDAEAGELADRLAEISYLLSDVAADVASYASRIDIDPARLAAVSERRAALTALTRKYGESIDEVLAWAETSARRLLELDDTDERIEQLRAEQEQLRTDLAAAAAALSTARQSCAADAGGGGHRRAARCSPCRTPGSSIEVRQHEVDAPAAPVPGGPLRVGERWLRYAPSGIDEVEFLLAANVGSEPRPLRQGRLRR